MSQCSEKQNISSQPPAVIRPRTGGQTFGVLAASNDESAKNACRVLSEKYSGPCQKSLQRKRLLEKIMKGRIQNIAAVRYIKQKPISKAFIVPMEYLKNFDSTLMAPQQVLH